MFSPTSTFSSLARSPIIFRMGTGTFLARVGMAWLWSPAASCGCTSRSTTSILYWSFKCSSQYFFRLFRAVTDLGVLPAIYSLSSHLYSFSAAFFLPFAIACVFCMYAFGMLCYVFYLYLFLLYILFFRLIYYIQTT